MAKRYMISPFVVADGRRAKTEGEIITTREFIILKPSRDRKFLPSCLRLRLLPRESR